MNKLFLIKYEFEDGVRYISDTAIVLAVSEDDAEDKLTKAINRIDSETVMVKIHSIEKFTGDIFTRCGYFEASQQRKVRV